MHKVGVKLGGTIIDSVIPAALNAADTRFEPVRVLLLSDDAAVAAELSCFFEHYLPDQTLVVGGRHAFDRAREPGVVTVLLDVDAPSSDPQQGGQSALDRVQAENPQLPMLVLVGDEADPLAAASLRAGALDFLVKNRLEDAWLLRALRHALEQYRLLSGLAAAEAGFQALVLSNPDGMVMLDDDGTIRFANPAAEALFGRAQAELVGSSFGFPVATGRSVELELLRAGGATVVEMHVTRTVWHGERLFLASLRDVTLRKRAEETLAQLNRDLEARVAERTQEVRALALELASAEAAERRRIAQLLHDDLQQWLVATQFALHGVRSYVGTEGEGALETAQSMVKEAVKKCRLTAASFTAPVAASGTLDELLTGLAEELRRQFGFRLEVSGADAVQFDSEVLRKFMFQTVRELLLNIVKHAGVLEAELRLSQNGVVSRLEVSDRGRGFDPQSLTVPNLSTLTPAGHDLGSHPATSPFESADVGTGLGLTGLKKRVALLGGTLDIASAPGVGTRVRVSLPRTS